ncbi:alkanesulfonate monooxygenase SsuD/methylene tetrahydromethanopterin reductase-like flavin-dependent oxidoreductase (luciferase family) [Streptomyces sp. V4I2]|nr:alkanesulfonate monooxygenase SsuD/methylene tetrahydromethanopterin reductase-like flavin-dependent oxidoreductase (luciferase family) [Streptomyces sp. V4I2]
MDKIQPVNLQGKHAASCGPLPIPPSEQGQPVIFQAGGGSYGLELAGRYAGGVYANPYTIEDARAQRQALRDAAKRAGRDPDEVKMLAGFIPTIAPSRQAALQRRRFLDEGSQCEPVRALNQNGAARRSVWPARSSSFQSR